MRRIVLALSFLLAYATSAFAQSGCSTIVTGAVLTAAQWNACFAAKQNVLGFTPLSVNGGVMTGRLVTAASTTTAAGFNIPAGTAPTSPVDGDIWTTTAGVFARINGSTVGLGGGTILLANGSAAAPSLAFTSDTDTGMYRVGANNIGISAGGSKIMDLGTNASGVYVAVPGAAAAGSGYPFVGGGWDTSGVILLHPEQKSIYIYGDFGSTAYFADYGLTSWGYAIGNIGNNNFGLLYTTHSFSITPPFDVDTKLSQVWAPSWTYIQNPVASTGVNPTMNTGPAFGWGFATIGATDVVNKTQGLGGTDFVFSNWNDVAMKNLVFIRSTGANLEVHSQNATDIPLVVKGSSTQSANLTLWRDSSNNALASLDKDGYLTLGITAGLNFAISPTAVTGFFADGTNVALRTYATTAKIYFQNASGATTFGDWDSTRLNIANATASTSTTTGALTVAGGLGVAGALNAASFGLSGPFTVTSASATCVSVGPNGATNPTFQIDCSTASAATGVKITPNAAGSGAQIAALSSNTNDSLSVLAKGTGTIQVGTGSQQVTIGGTAGTIALRFINDNLTGFGSRAPLETNNYANSQETMRWAQTVVTSFATFRANSNLVANATQTIASGASAAWNDFEAASHTTTLTGSTTITSPFAKSVFFGGTLTDASAVTVNNAAAVYIDAAPVAAGSVTITAGWSLFVNSGRALFGGGLTTTIGSTIMVPTQTIVSAGAAVWSDLELSDSTMTLTGTTTVNALARAYIGGGTITDSSSVTVTSATTMFVAAPPAAAGSVTITNPWAFRVGSGNAGLPAGGYLNFGATGSSSSGTNGYGIRDNGGVMEKKNSGGAWSAL